MHDGPTVEGDRGGTLGDVDGDGALDHVASAIGSEFDGGPHADVLWLYRGGSGPGGLGPPTAVGSPGGWSSPVQLADFDADGPSDVLTLDSDQDATTPEWRRLRFGDGTGAFGHDRLLVPSAAVIGDFDGDGRADLAGSNRVGTVQIYLNRLDDTAR